MSFTIAKSLANGLPIGARPDRRRRRRAACKPAITARPSAARPCRARPALEHLRIRDEIDLDAHVRDVGTVLRGGLEALAAEFPQAFTSPRGAGLILGLPVREPYEAKSIVDAARIEQKFFVNAAGSNTLRLRPAADRFARANRRRPAPPPRRNAKRPRRARHVTLSGGAGRRSRRADCSRARLARGRIEERTGPGGHSCRFGSSTRSRSCRPRRRRGSPVFVSGAYREVAGSSKPLALRRKRAPLAPLRQTVSVVRDGPPIAEGMFVVQVHFPINQS